MITSQRAWSLGDTIPMIVDQREYQRLGGVCTRNPYSCYICDVVEKMLENFGLPGLGEARIADATWGEGRFWEACRRSIGFLAGADIVKREWAIEPDVFVQGDSTSPEILDSMAEHGPYHVLVVDPPYANRVSQRDSERLVKHNEGGIHAWRKLMSHVPVMAQKLLARGGIVLVKGMVAQEKRRIIVETLPGYWLERWKGLEPAYLLWYRLLHRRRPGLYSVYTNNATWLLVLHKP